MASINGVSIKSLKWFRDHEGCGIAQGNVYIDNKKVGFWSQDSWGGPDQYISDTSADLYSLIKERAEKFKEGYPKESKYYHLADDPDCFMFEILKLIDDEKAWKSHQKMGYPCTIFVTNGFRTGSLMSKRQLPESVLENETIKERCDKIKKELGDASKAITYIVNSKADLEIICDSNHKVPKRLVAL